MRKPALIGVAAAAAIALLAAPSGAGDRDRPAGLLVLGLHPPERIAVVDVRSGHTVVRRVSGGTLCHGPLVVSGGRVVMSRAAGDRPAVDSLDLGLGHRRRLGVATHYLASATPRRLWLATMRYGRHPRLGSIREVTAAGRATFVSRHRAPALNLVGALDDGLLFERRDHLLVWSPRSGRVVRRLPGAQVLSSRGGRVAWCRGRCAQVHLAGRRGDRVRSLPAPALTGALSPDGALLAVALVDGRLAIVDVLAGSVREVPGVRIADGAGAIAWAPDGDWLFFAAPRGRLMAYRPSSEQLETLPARPRGHVLELAAG
jgi:hypothetical protein